MDMYVSDTLGCVGDIIYYEQQLKRELNRIHISGCRYNGRLKTKTDGSKRLAYTGYWEVVITGLFIMNQQSES